MPNNAKLSATRFAAVRRRDSDASGTCRVVVETVFLSGTPRSKKVECVVQGAHNEGDVRSAVLDQLVDAFPSDSLKPKDILLFGF